MANTLQTLIKDTLKENGEKPRNEERDDEGKGEPSNNKKEEEGEKGTPQTHLHIDRLE